MKKMSVRRKLVIATWKAAAEGNIYGKINIDVSQALRYIEHLRGQSQTHVTITHLVGKAAALALAQAPGLNGRIFLGRYVPHSTVDITYLVALEDGGNLAKAKVSETDKKSVMEIAEELNALAQRLRQGKDHDFKKSQSSLRILPTWLIRPMLWLTGWMTASLGIGARSFGLERFPFGSCVVTNVGVFGLDEAYAPPTPFARVPVWVLVGAIKRQPVVMDEQVVIRPIMPLCATIDHRFMDGQHGAVLARVVRESLEQPWKLDGLSAPPWESIEEGSHLAVAQTS